MLDLNDVALFVEVVRAGSFAATARRLGLPANTISRRLEEFERRIGQRLIQRSTRRMAPTSAGQALFAKCAQPVESLIQSARDLVEGTHEPRGKVRVLRALSLAHLLKPSVYRRARSQSLQLSAQELLDRLTVKSARAASSSRRPPAHPRLHGMPFGSPARTWRRRYPAKSLEKSNESMNDAIELT